MTKDWTGNTKSTWAALAASNHSDSERETNDYYATDPKALDKFLQKANEDGLQLNEPLWECACGEGHLSRCLEKHGYKVISSDLIDRGFGKTNVDFLKTEFLWGGDIITNPPYKYAQEFVEHALKLAENGKQIIMFLKIQFLEGKKRAKLFKQKNLKFVYVHSERQICAINGDFGKIKSSASCYCWFVWQKGYVGEPKVRWIT